MLNDNFALKNVICVDEGEHLKMTVGNPVDLSENNLSYDETVPSENDKYMIRCEKSC